MRARRPITAALTAALAVGTVVAAASPGWADATSTTAPDISNPNGRYFMATLTIDAGPGGGGLPFIQTTDRQRIAAHYSVTGGAADDQTTVVCVTSTDPADVASGGLGGSFLPQDGPGAHDAYADPALLALAANGTGGSIPHECHYRAVPTSTPTIADTDHFPFSPTVTDLGTSIVERFPLNSANGGAPWIGLSLLPAPGASVVIEGPHSSGALGLGSGGGGLLAQALLDSSGAPAGSLWSTGDALLTDNGLSGDAEHSGIRVDGHDAFGSIIAALLASGSGGRDVSLPEQPSVSMVRDPATGDYAMTFTEPLSYCLDAAGHPEDEATSSMDCASLGATGVRMVTTWTVTQQGVLTRDGDQLVSASGTHQVALEYVNSAPSTVGWQLPGEPSPSVHLPGDIDTTTWPSVGSIIGVADVGGTPNGSLDDPAGALTYSTRPNAAHVLDAGEVLQLDYTKTVASGHPVTLSHTFTTTSSLSSAQSAAATDQAAQAPTATLDAVPATVGSKTVTVTGTFKPGGNGLPETATVGTTAGSVVVPVAPDGRFTANVPLVEGANTITALGTDANGLAATASASTAFVNPVTAGRAVVKKTRAKTGPHAGKVTKVVVSVPVSCASFAPATGCKVTVKDGLNGKPLGSKTVTIKPGKQATVAMTLAKAPAKVNALKKGKHLDSRLTVTYSDPGGSPLASPVRKVRLA
ncbi:MAG TPA: hypothetical protein VHE83_06620 [Mycobacteriales bacterium]|nr:hypothetical protein [Mycobacteriales bacterium]